MIKNGLTVDLGFDSGHLALSGRGDSLLDGRAVVDCDERVLVRDGLEALALAPVVLGLVGELAQEKLDPLVQAQARAGLTRGLGVRYG